MTRLLTIRRVVVEKAVKVRTTLTSGSVRPSMPAKAARRKGRLRLVVHEHCPFGSLFLAAL